MTAEGQRPSGEQGIDPVAKARGEFVQAMFGDVAQIPGKLVTFENVLVAHGTLSLAETYQELRTTAQLAGERLNTTPGVSDETKTAFAHTVSRYERVLDALQRPQAAGPTPTDRLPMTQAKGGVVFNAEQPQTKEPETTQTPKKRGRPRKTDSTQPPQTNQ